MKEKRGAGRTEFIDDDEEHSQHVCDSNRRSYEYLVFALTEVMEHAWCRDGKKEKHASKD